MAERRMFARKIVDSDVFLDMPATTQLLYFHLGMRADDDGFVDKPRSVMRMIGGSENDLDLLFAKQFLIPFESGVVVIKHWKIHNYIRKDRYSETIYLDEKAALSDAKNGIYDAGLPKGNQKATNGLPMVDPGKDRLGKDRLGENKEGTADKPPTFKTEKPPKYGEYQNVLLTDEEMDKLRQIFPADLPARIERLSEYIASTGKKYKSHYATILAWAKREGPNQSVSPTTCDRYQRNIGPNGIPIDPTKTDLDGLF